MAETLSTGISVKAVDDFLKVYAESLGANIEAELSGRDGPFDPYVPLEYGVMMNGYELVTSAVMAMAGGNDALLGKCSERLAGCLAKYREGLENGRGEKEGGEGA